MAIRVAWMDHYMVSISKKQYALPGNYFICDPMGRNGILDCFRDYNTMGISGIRGRNAVLLFYKQKNESRVI